jgi:hypothetical protein
LCLVRVGCGEEGEEEEEEGVEGGVLSCVHVPRFLGRRLAKRAGPEWGWLRRRNRARSRPCARPNGPHKGGRPKASGPPRRGRPPVVSREGAPQEEPADLLGDEAAVWGNDPKPRTRQLRCRNRTGLRPCASQQACTRAVARGEAGHSEEGRYPWS